MIGGLNPSGCSKKILALVAQLEESIEFLPRSVRVQILPGAPISWRSKLGNQDFDHEEQQHN
jgi:hypothetical protein